MKHLKHLFFAVDEDGTECAFTERPLRSDKMYGDYPRWWYAKGYGAKEMPLPLGTIKHITGKTITWADKPIRWKP